MRAVPGVAAIWELNWGSHWYQIRSSHDTSHIFAGYRPEAFSIQPVDDKMQQVGCSNIRRDILDLRS